MVISALILMTNGSWRYAIHSFNVVISIDKVVISIDNVVISIDSDGRE